MKSLEASNVFTKSKEEKKSNLILMCKNIPIYNVTTNLILNQQLLPGSISRGTLTYLEWMKTRYSVGSNVSARRLMLRAFGSDNHNTSLGQTRALSLSDCYWLMYEDENLKFEEVTPYIHKEWDGVGRFQGGSISTLFVNGAADKKWVNKNTLVKFSSSKELIPYKLAEQLGLDNLPNVRLEGSDLYISNFTSIDVMLETMEQSGFVGNADNPQDLAVTLFKEQAVALFTLDYLVEHDDRHWGNYGFLRDSNSGEYLGMAHYYDFDWAWSDGVIPLPQMALTDYKLYIQELCKKSIEISSMFDSPYKEVIEKRAKELLLEVSI